MQVWSHKNFLIPHFHLSLCSLSKSPHLRNSALSPKASLSLLVPILYLFLTCIVPTIYLSLEQILCFPLFLPPCHNSTMPRERGKPKQGVSYYKFISRCNLLDPSLPSNPSTIVFGPTHFDQNWLGDPQPPLGNTESPPHLSDPMLDSGGLPIKE